MLSRLVPMKPQLHLIHYLITVILLTPGLEAKMKDLKSYEAAFKQTIIDQDNVKIVYTGTFKALKPLHAVWHYQTPVEKSVYINNQQVVIVEPELEQAIYKYSKNNFTLFNILDNATKIDKHTYEKRINDRTYKLKVNNDTILSLEYLDNFENKVYITFSKQKPNLTLQSKSFHPIISEDYDIIKE